MKLSLGLKCHSSSAQRWIRVERLAKTYNISLDVFVETWGTGLWRTSEKEVLL
jgi:hypothetical protein